MSTAKEKFKVGDRVMIGNPVSSNGKFVVKSKDYDLDGSVMTVTRVLSRRSGEFDIVIGGILVRGQTREIHFDHRELELYHSSHGIIFYRRI